MNKSSGSPILTKKTTSGRMLGCYILCSERIVIRLSSRGGLTG
jgi:hypothetical protein